MNIHSIKSIKLREVKKLEQSKTFVRKLTVTDKEGNTFELKLFADDLNDLTFKTEIQEVLFYWWHSLRMSLNKATN